MDLLTFEHGEPVAAAIISPSGDRIAALSLKRMEKRIDLELSLLQGEGFIERAVLAYGVADAVWSPDGNKLALVTYRDSMSDIYVVDADGTDFGNLTNTPTWNDDSPAWSPDGKRIAFVSTEIPESSSCDYDCIGGRIYVMDIDGTGRQLLTDFPIKVHASGGVYVTVNALVS